MAHAPTNPGFGAAATLAKKKKLLAQAAQKPTGSFDPSGSLGGYSPQQLASMSPDQLAQVQFALGMAGPQQPDFEALQAAALRSAQASAQPTIDYINQERARQDARQKLSSDAATNFSAAFAQILQGGKTGAEGEQYALENFGGSYLGGIAARMGQQLISQQAEYFNEQDYKLASQLADVMDNIPGEADKIYQDLVSQTQDILSAPYKNQIAAIAALIKNKRDAMGGGSDHPYTKNFSDGTTRQWNPKTGKWDVVTTKADAAAGGGEQIVYASGVPYFVDPVTRDVRPVVPGTGTAQGAKKASAKAAASSGATKSERIYGNSETGYYYIRNGKKVPIKGTGSAAAGAGGTGGAVSPSSASTTVARAQKAATDVLESWTNAIRQKYALPENASDAQKAANTQKYQAELSRNFGRAMYKVITAIAPHLKAVGYSPARIKWEAYQMVRAAGLTPLPSYKAPKPPKASAARVAASTLPSPQAIDFNWLASATTGKTGWSDLGGPSAHYSKHDSGENWQSNNAWDIGMPVGTPIYAVADGVIGPDVGVQASRPDDGSRLTLNGQGNSFWYGHLSKVAVRPGQRVKAGQLLGYSGVSQNGAAHLHIGVMNIGGNYS